MNRGRRQLLLTAVSSMVAPAAQAMRFDHGHRAWTALLKKHLLLVRGGQTSLVRYAGFAADRPALRGYLDSLSTVPRGAFEGFRKLQQQAFLINAYNAFTVELVLTRYPDLKSIKDLGGLFSTPWESKWIGLLGSKLSLDDIEHGMLRQRGVYDEPRVHFAVNCASIGCPMLREEAFVPDLLDAQLAQQAERFMADRTRNRWNARRRRLELSKIFDWYGDDFRLGHRGIRSVGAFAALHAERLADASAEHEHIRSGKADIAFLDYDWTLNDVDGEGR